MHLLHCVDSGGLRIFQSGVSLLANFLHCVASLGRTSFTVVALPKRTYGAASLARASFAAVALLGAHLLHCAASSARASFTAVALRSALRRLSDQRIFHRGGSSAGVPSLGRASFTQVALPQTHPLHCVAILGPRIFHSVGSSGAHLLDCVAPSGYASFTALALGGVRSALRRLFGQHSFHSAGASAAHVLDCGASLGHASFTVVALRGGTFLGCAAPRGTCQSQRWLFVGAPL